MNEEKSDCNNYSVLFQICSDENQFRKIISSSLKKLDMKDDQLFKIRISDYPTTGIKSIDNKFIDIVKEDLKYNIES